MPRPGRSSRRASQKVSYVEDVDLGKASNDELSDFPGNTSSSSESDMVSALEESEESVVGLELDDDDEVVLEDIFATERIESDLIEVENRVYDLLQYYVNQHIAQPLTPALLDKICKAAESAQKQPSRRRRCDELTPSDDHKVIPIETLPETERYPCPVPHCSKDFLNLPGIAYHFKQHKHHIVYALDDISRNDPQVLPEEEFARILPALRKLTWPMQVPDTECWIIKNTRPTFYPIGFGFDDDALPIEAQLQAEKDMIAVPKAKTSRKGEKYAAIESRISIIRKNEKDITVNYQGHSPQMRLASMDEAQACLPQQRPLDLTWKMTGDQSTTHSLSLMESAQFDAISRQSTILNVGMGIMSIVTLTHGKEGEFVMVGGYRDPQERHNYSDLQTTDMGNAIQVHGLSDPIKTMFVLTPYGCLFDMSIYRFNSKFSQHPSRLCLLAACFGDGSMRLLDIPVPSSLSNSSAPIYLDLEPILTLQIPGKLARAVSWSVDGNLAVGFNDGSVAVYDLSGGIIASRDSCPHRPKFMIPIHDSSIRCLGWSPSHVLLPPTNPKQPQLLSSANDGRLLMTDIRNPFESHLINRFTSLNVTHIAVPHAVINIDNEMQLRMYMPAQTATKVQSTVLAAHQGYIWDVDTHDSGKVVSVSSDGTLIVSFPAVHFHRKSPKQALLLTTLTDENGLVMTDSSTLIDTKMTDRDLMIFDPMVQLRCVKFVPSDKIKIATGALCGLLRIDTIAL